MGHGIVGCLEEMVMARAMLRRAMLDICSWPCFWVYSSSFCADFTGPGAMKVAADQRHGHAEEEVEEAVVAVEAPGAAVTIIHQPILLRHIQLPQRRPHGPQHHDQEHPLHELSRKDGDPASGAVRLQGLQQAIWRAEETRHGLKHNPQDQILGAVGSEVVGVAQAMVDHLHLDLRDLDQVLLVQDTSTGFGGTSRR